MPTVNDFTFNQLATVLTTIVQEATGITDIETPLNTNEFVSVGQLALKTGYDPVINAVSQVLARTIFSIRPYNAKFKGLRVTEQKFGGWDRKLNILDSDWSEDDRIKLVDGQSIDPYIVKKPPIVQTNFYGSNVYQRHITLFRDQLDVAFSSPDEFGRFITMVTQNASDQIEQAHEATARACIANLAGGIASDATNFPSRVLNVLTDYNKALGLSGAEAFTVQTIMRPENYTPFIQWLSGYISKVCDMMTERTTLYHTNITSGTDTPKIFTRHTPLDRQRVYLLNDLKFEVQSRVLADKFHDNYVKFSDTESVNFWQDPKNPTMVNVKSTYLRNNGTLATNQNSSKIGYLLGIIMDEEAAGYTVVNQWSAPTPFNPRGGYTNIFYHFTDRYVNDFTENAIILKLN